MLFIVVKIDLKNWVFGSSIKIFDTKNVLTIFKPLLDITG